MIGKRIVVTGMAGAGKSTFSKALAEKTNLPLIHLDLYLWAPDWVRVPQLEFVETQRRLLSEDTWIVDSNDVDEALLIERADTLIILETPWWICSWRAFLRGLKRPTGSQLPEGCHESHSQRLVDEWGIVWRNWRNRHAIRMSDRALAERCQDSKSVHTLSSKGEAENFLSRL